MLSIPQNMQNEAKNIIKNVFLEKCRNLFSETMDNLFYSFFNIYNKFKKK